MTALKVIDGGGCVAAPADVIAERGHLKVIRGGRPG